MRAVIFLIALAVSLAGSLFFLGSAHVATGILGGILVSMTSLFLLSRSIRKAASASDGVSWGDFARSFLVRLVVAAGLLILFIGALKVNSIGVLAGLLAGLVIHTFFLTSLKVRP